MLTWCRRDREGGQYAKQQMNTRHRVLVAFTKGFINLLCWCYRTFMATKSVWFLQIENVKQFTCVFICLLFYAKLLLCLSAYAEPSYARPKWSKRFDQIWSFAHEAIWSKQCDQMTKAIKIILWYSTHLKLCESALICAHSVFDIIHAFPCDVDYFSLCYMCVR